ncbi:malate synthase [Priestia taiwanensis]|uniref:Malate synthase n=2 Tax=Priestia taiwanensis TaxID=1347902 RepID=A0A917ASK2_9BACI|nr:malate synthase [Priestia taiwanensis]
MEIVQLDVMAEMKETYHEILSEEALMFLKKLHQQFEPQRQQLLEWRQERMATIHEGDTPHFLPETEHIRNGDWTINKLPAELHDRRVEITGPVDRKMIINALNSGAKLFMADFEDSTSPTWSNVVEGQLHLRDAVNGTIEHEEKGKKYTLNEKQAALIVRPRGLHLNEKHIVIDGKQMSGSFFDFGLYFFHNAKALLEKGSGPYFYLPKLESHLEARLWNDVFVFAQNELNIPQGTIKATVLIETIWVAFEMDEILYELKEHSAGLNCGRWDYIFSFIKTFHQHPTVLFPDRSEVTMMVPCMRAYSLLAIQTCHKRQAPAMGGMAAQIPIKHDEEANNAAFEKVRQDKEREAHDGHDGTWVAHPALVPVAMEVFNKYMPTPNQFHKQYERKITSQHLLQIPEGNITEQGLRTNITVAIQYIESWLRGRGAVPIFNLMEDAATAEISRAQVWQWIRHPKGVLMDGRNITHELVQTIQEEEVRKIEQHIGADAYTKGKFDEAAQMFTQLIESDQFCEFLTLPGYEKL